MTRKIVGKPRRYGSMIGMKEGRKPRKKEGRKEGR